jgi:hypothetical protein
LDQLLRVTTSIWRAWAFPTIPARKLAAFIASDTLNVAANTEKTLYQCQLRNFTHGEKDQPGFAARPVPTKYAAIGFTGSRTTTGNANNPSVV